MLCFARRAGEELRTQGKRQGIDGTITAFAIVFALVAAVHVALNTLSIVASRHPARNAERSPVARPYRTDLAA